MVAATLNRHLFVHPPVAGISEKYESILSPKEFTLLLSPLHSSTFSIPPKRNPLSVEFSSSKIAPSSEPFPLRYSRKEVWGEGENDSGKWKCCGRLNPLSRMSELFSMIEFVEELIVETQLAGGGEFTGLAGADGKDRLIIHPGSWFSDGYLPLDSAKSREIDSLKYNCGCVLTESTQLLGQVFKDLLRTRG